MANLECIVKEVGHGVSRAGRAWEEREVEAEQDGFKKILVLVKYGRLVAGFYLRANKQHRIFSAAMGFVFFSAFVEGDDEQAIFLKGGIF